MRKISDDSPSASPHRLALALFCAFSGCLNPLPEEYPSETSAPVAPGSTSADPTRQGSDLNPSLAPNSEPALPDEDAPENTSGPPTTLVPPPQPAQPGSAPAPDADAGPSDAGATTAPDAGSPPSGD
ncbi:MAG TPA: hypothetical protein VMG12_33940 [Polyangiaceae bacterium]|nr:hypothetical protein [Polyangiaceae bacterium]